MRRLGLILSALVPLGSPLCASPASAIADLRARGVLRQHAPAAAPPLPGEVGSGYRTGEAGGHVEPREIFVLGTSHVSERSASDVEMAVMSLQPDAVVVELCRSRTGLMYADEAPVSDRAGNAFGLSGEGNPLQVLQRSLALGGWAPLLMRTVLVRLSDRVGESLAVTPGSDFRAARRAADAVNATVVLGDRPIEITLERCWRGLSGRERLDVLRAIWGALGARASGQGDSEAATALRRARMRRLVERALGDDGRSAVADADRLAAADRASAADRIIEGGGGDDDEEDALALMEAELSARYPSLVGPLVRERDIFLSLTIKSSRAVSGRRRVLGIVGVGHLDGVMTALAEDHHGAFKRLTWTPSRAAAKQTVLGVPRPLATRLAFDAAIGAAVCAWWWVTAAGG